MLPYLLIAEKSCQHEENSACRFLEASSNIYFMMGLLFCEICYVYLFLYCLSCIMKNQS
uniref:Uncharacterized protein n=1 Tax=Picea sitchensis TaxID=3332 RepID=D5ABL5_PICSI|nr:unknown [Picea sitchensis]